MATGSETWTGTDGATWAAPWTLATPAGGTQTIQGNRGRQVTPTTAYWCDIATYALTVPSLDATVTCFLANPIAEQYPRIHFRCDVFASGNSQPSNGYTAGLDTLAGVITLSRIVGTIETQLQSAAYTFTAGQAVNLRLTGTGGSLRLRVWNVGSAESTATVLRAYDGTRTTGLWGLNSSANVSGRICEWDDLSWDDAPATITGDAVDVVGTSAVFGSILSTVTPTLPAHVSGDYLLVQVAGRPLGTAGTNDTITATAGWALLGARVRNATAPITSELWWKRATSNAETNPTFTVGTNFQGSTAGYTAVALVLRNVDTTTAVDVGPTNATAAAATPFAPTAIAVPTAGSRLLSFVASADDNAIGFNSQNGWQIHASGTSYNYTAGADQAVAITSKFVQAPSTPATPSYSQTLVSPDVWVSQLVAFRVAAPVAPEVWRPRVMSM